MSLDPVSRALAVRAIRTQQRSIEQYGADPAITAAPATNTAAFRDAFLAGGANLIVSGPGYALAALSWSEPARLQRNAQQPVMLLPADLKVLDGRGATLQLASSSGILGAVYASYAYPEVRSDLGADVTAGDLTLKLAPGEGAKWTAGDDAVYRFGSLPYDHPEPLLWGIAKVRAVNGDVLTLDAPVPEGFARASAANLTFTDEFGVANRRNSTVHKWPLITDLVVRDMEIVGTSAGVTEIGLWVQGGRRVTYSRVTARNVGAGFGMQYVDGGLIDNCAMFDCATPDNPSLNKGIGIAETRGLEIRQFVCSGVRSVVAAEANAEASVNGGRFDNTGNPIDGSSYGTQCIPFLANGRSQLIVRDFTVTGHGGYVLSEISNGSPAYDGLVRFEGKLTLIHATMPASFGRLADFNCLLDLRIGSNRALWDFANAQWITRRIWLRNGLDQNLSLPNGYLKQLAIYTSPGVVAGDVTALYIGRTNDNGGDFAARLVPGQTTPMPNAGDSGGIFDRAHEQLKILVATAQGTRLDTSGEFIDVHCQLVPDLLAPSATWTSDADARSLGPADGLRSAQVVGYDLQSIAAGGTQTVDYAVPAMAPGDLVEAVSLATDLAGVRLRGFQAIAGACRVVFENPGGSAVDLPATTVRILWRKSPLDN